MTEHVTIAGAGLAGSLLSIYLARRGMQVTLFERRADLRTTQQSAGRSINLALANRGLRALQEVGLDDDVQRLLIPMRGRMLHEGNQAPKLQPYGNAEHEVIYSISRPGLNHLLLDAAEQHGVDIRFEQTLKGVDIEHGVLTLLDNRTGNSYPHQASPFIATDGSGSLVRRTMGFTPGANSSEEFLEHGYKELTIPADAQGQWQLDAHALHVWPRGSFMLIALPNLDGSFTVTLFMPREGTTSFAQLDSTQRINEFFATTFASAHALMPDVAEQFLHNPTGRMVTVRCSPWYFQDKVALLGDAAHAIVPFHGQGMNCAFEDCRVFDKILSEGYPAAPNWRAVFALFQARRLDNANAIADLALENYIVMRESVRDPRFHLKKTLSFELESRFPTHFIPRYSMVMFHHVPYALAQSRGVTQEGILDELIGRHNSLEHIDYHAARALIEQRLAPLDQDMLDEL